MSEKMERQFTVISARHYYQVKRSIENSYQRQRRQWSE